MQHSGALDRKQRHSLLYRPEDRNAQSATGWLANTGSSPTLADIQTEEGVSRRDPNAPYAQTQGTFLNLQEDLRGEEDPAVVTPPPGSIHGSGKAPLSPTEEVRVSQQDKVPA